MPAKKIVFQRVDENQSKANEKTSRNSPNESTMELQDISSPESSEAELSSGEEVLSDYKRGEFLKEPRHQKFTYSQEELEAEKLAVFIGILKDMKYIGLYQTNLDSGLMDTEAKEFSYLMTTTARHLARNYCSIATGIHATEKSKEGQFKLTPLTSSSLATKQ